LGDPYTALPVFTFFFLPYFFGGAVVGKVAVGPVVMVDEVTDEVGLEVTEEVVEEVGVEVVD